MEKDLDRLSKADAALEHRFFHATGGVMVLGTLVAGAIMLWLAANTQAPPTTNFTANLDVKDQAVTEPQEAPALEERGVQTVSISAESGDLKTR